MARSKEAEENLHGLHGEAGTVEGRLADLIENASSQVKINSCDVSYEERMIIVKCLRERARWMVADIHADERPRKRQRR